MRDVFVYTINNTINKEPVGVVAMNPDMALQKLSEVKEVVDGETEEMVDALATIVTLQKDVSHPMLGSKVTLYLRPPTEEQYEVDPDEAPEPDSDDWNWQWIKTTTGDSPDYYFKPKKNENDPDIVEHEAIVIEGNVAGDAPEEELWDPNKQEYKNPDEYPLGTVNVVVAQDYHSDELISFSEGYCTNVEVYTSILPANNPENPSAHTYTPGWPD